VLPNVAEDRKYRDALPVFDLQAQAGEFSEAHSPEPVGWIEVKSARALDRRMFVGRVRGASMEPGIPDGSWAVFRAFPAGSAPSAASLDGRRVAVQLRADADPETGGHYTLKRWRVGKLDADGGAEVIELRPDNPSFKVRTFSAGSEEIRVVAELVEVLA
ncbi:MAG: helix-turn-helix transcriptional regulator, partial [Byssovorax sp.]